MNIYNGHDPSINTLFSRDRVYRYVWIKRVIAGNNFICHFVMLNPSTADEYGPDPTIAKCIKFAQKWNRGILVVTNLFGLRSTNPQNLFRVKDPVGGYLNDVMISGMAKQAQHAIVAWGNRGSLHGRSSQVRTILQNTGALTYCLDVNASGEPKHPLYIRDSQELLWYPQEDPNPAMGQGSLALPLHNRSSLPGLIDHSIV